MKLSKFVVFGVAVAMSFGAFADAANKVIKFSSANDTYADGVTPVVDGEWYALCWANGEFEGLTTDCMPVDTNDKVLLVAPLAKGGGCPTIRFQVKNAPIGGKYFVYLLDTRINGKVSAKNDEGKPIYVASAKEASVYTIVGASGEKTEGAEIPAWVASIIDTKAEGFESAKITAFNATKDGAEFTITGLKPGVTYGIKMGTELDNLDSLYTIQPLASITDSVTITITTGAKFFKLVYIK